MAFITKWPNFLNVNDFTLEQWWNSSCWLIFLILWKFIPWQFFRANWHYNLLLDLKGYKVTVRQNLQNCNWIRSAKKYYNFHQAAWSCSSLDKIQGIVIQPENPDSIVGWYILCYFACLIQFQGSFCGFRPNQIWTPKQKINARFYLAIAQHKLNTSDYVAAKNWPHNSQCSLWSSTRVSSSQPTMCFSKTYGSMYQIDHIDLNSEIRSSETMLQLCPGGRQWCSLQTLTWRLAPLSLSCMLEYLEGKKLKDFLK